MQAHVKFTFTPSFLGNCHKLQPTKLSSAPLPALRTHTWDLTTGLQAGAQARNYGLYKRQ